MHSYWAYRVAALISRGFPLRVAYWIGLRLADLFFLASRGQRAAMQRNLMQIYASRGVIPSSGHLTGMVRKTYQYFGKYLVDFFRCARLDPAVVARKVSFQHAEHLHQAAAMGRGVIVASAHFGNWELGGAVMASMGHEVHVVVLPERMRKLEQLLERHRFARGFKVLPVGHAARGILRCLRAGGLVALLADRALGGRTATCLFFGRPATLPSGPVALAYQTGAPIVPGFLSRQEDDTFLFRCYPPILREREGTPAAMQRALAACLEAEIAEHPNQWFVFEDFWPQNAAVSPP